MSSYNSILHILGEDIAPGESREINFHVAKLHTRTRVEVPVIINRSKKKRTSSTIYSWNSWR